MVTFVNHMHAENRPHTRNALCNRLLEAGRYQEILDRLPEWRSLDGDYTTT
jgi:hypothetical protein